jgi:hypothetical protein
MVWGGITFPPDATRHRQLPLWGSRVRIPSSAPQKLQVRRYDDSLGPDAEPSAWRNRAGRAAPCRTDPAVLKVLRKVKPGASRGYDRVECGSCGAGRQVPYFRRSRQVTRRGRESRCGSVGG